MRNWLLRGLVFAAAMLAVRLVQGALINAFPTQAGLISIVLLLIFVVGVVLWGLRDGRDDAKANPDPDRRGDLAMVWLVAGLIAGILSGVVASLIALFYQALYTGGAINEVTTFAAFTALLVFVPAIAATTVGRLLIDRQYAKAPVRHHGLAAEGEDRADTDVFAAVGAPHAAGDATTAATAVGGEATRPARYHPDAAPTEEFPTEAAGRGPAGAIPPDEDTTGVIRPDDKS